MTTPDPSPASAETRARLLRDIGDRIHSLVNRGAEICDSYDPREPLNSVPGCKSCGYQRDVHLLRDVLRAERAPCQECAEIRALLLAEPSLVEGDFRGPTLGAAWELRTQLASVQRAQADAAREIENLRLQVRTLRETGQNQALADDIERWRRAQAEQRKAVGWTTVEAKVPPRHAQHVVRRDGRLFTATPCYGMHEPWWVVRLLRGDEADPVTMLPTDEWYPLSQSPAPEER